MDNSPYTTPESDLAHHPDVVVKTNSFTKKGRLSIISWLGQSILLTLTGIFLLIGIGATTSMVYGTGRNLTLLKSLEPSNPIVWITGIAVLVVFLLLTWVSFCQTIKRLHDINFNGWWVLSIFLVVGLILLAIPGKEVPNRFGAWRKTRAWEKILTVLFFSLLTLSVVGAFFGFV